MQRTARHILHVVTLAALVGLSGCAGSGGVEPAASGTAPVGTAPVGTAPAPTEAGGPPRVTGTVTAGPVCPVESNPPDPACAPRPVAGAVIVATDRAGVELCRATTLADGTYELVIPQTGTVLVSGEPVPGLMGVPEPATVNLAAPTEVVRVDLVYDTGIR